MGKVLNICKNELMPRIDHLNDQFKKAYFDIAFLFSNVEILEEWTTLVDLIETINDVKDEIDEIDNEEDSRLLLLNQLALYKLNLQYMHLHGSYLAATNELTKPIATQEVKELNCSSVNANQHIAELCGKMRKTCSDMQSALSDIRDFLQPVMNNGMEIIQKLCPSRVDIVKAIDVDIRQFTLCVADGWLDDMKRCLDRHYKAKLSDPYSFELWGEMLSEEDNALKMAMEGHFESCYDEKQDHWNEDVKCLMDKNSELIRRIWLLCNRDKFIDLTNPGDQGDIIPLLSAENLNMVYEIIVRRNLIQCEMFPELKAKFNAWMNPEGCQPEAFKGNPLKCTYHLAPNMKGHIAKLIASMYDYGMFLKEDNSPASNVEDLARALGTAFGEDFRNWRQTLNAAIDQQNCLDIFDDLQNKIKFRKQKRQ